MLDLAHTVLNPESNGPALVLGNSLGSTQMLWAAVADRLSDDYRVITFDLPGHGASAVPESEITISDIASAVTQMLDSQGIDVCNYAGVSLGGAIGLQLALQAPERVRSLAAVCTNSVFGTPESWMERIKTAQRSGMAELAHPTADRWFAAGFLDEDIAAGHMVMSVFKAVNPAGFIACAKALASYNISGQLPQLSVPTLFMAGVQDSTCPPEVMAALAQQVAGARFVNIPDAAHLPMVEHPELVADQLAAFFANPPSTM